MALEMEQKLHDIEARDRALSQYFEREAQMSHLSTVNTVGSSSLGYFQNLSGRH